MKMHLGASAAAVGALALLVPTLAQSAPDSLAVATAQAAKTLKAMSADDKVVLTHGIMPLPLFGGPPPPADAVMGAGYVPGIERLGVPALRESDASLGVSYVMGLRKDGATPLPSGLSQAASWNPDVLYKGGAMIGSEARAKGFNVLLAGGANLTRDPRNGRTFEYLSEDPLLTGTLVGAAISGIQSNDIISTIKHFALNGQETGRKFVNSVIDEGAARESDLLAFQIGIEKGQPGSVMCSYNVINGHHGCDNDWTLNQVLKRDWKYRGFVMSDWGAVTGVDTALHGLDQQSGAQLDPKLFFGDELKAKAASDPAYAAKLDDMNMRVLTQIYLHHLNTNPAQPGGTIDFAAHGAVALEAAEQGIVLLRNQNNALPLAATAKRIAVIGGYANSGVISGGGSSQVDLPGGPAISVPLGGEGPFAAFQQIHYHGSAPVKAIRALAPNAQITYRDGSAIADAVAQAKKSDVAIVFATKWSTEGLDQADLSLPGGQDALIAAVSAANPNTIVVLETGNPVDMPWLGQTAAVIEAWYPGARGGEAIANVLFGKVNPSGHLPITFPASTEQLPRPVLDGYNELEPNFAGDPPSADARLNANYNVEGSDVGYRWFARKQQKALFPFGYGLSYTNFSSSGLKVSGLGASFTVKNTGNRQGATVSQVYLVSRGGQAKQRLVGFARVDLAPGASQTVKLSFDPRLLGDWKNGGWSIAAGDYGFALGDDAEHLGTPVSVRMAARNWKD
jgi:beta-glucosidase